jgi:hypothetical protein
VFSCIFACVVDVISVNAIMFANVFIFKTFPFYINYLYNSFQAVLPDLVLIFCIYAAILSETPFKVK